MEEFWFECLENGREEEIGSSLKTIDSKGMDRGYFFIRTIGDLYRNGKCSKEIFKRAEHFYFKSLMLTPADF